MAAVRSESGKKTGRFFDLDVLYWYKRNCTRGPEAVPGLFSIAMRNHCDEDFASPYVFGDSMTQKQFYKSAPWRRARDGYIAFRKAIDGGICEKCGEEPGKIVHHKIWLDDNNCNDPDISLNPSNFSYECQTCHNKEKNPKGSSHKRKAPGRCGYGEHGEIIRNTDY